MDLTVTWEFVAWGILANLVSVVVMFVMVFVKTRGMSPEENEQLMNFVMARHTLIHTMNSPGRLFLYNSLALIPAYAACLNVIRLLWTLDDPGATGIILGLHKHDQFSIIQLLDHRRIMTMGSQV